MNGTTGGNGRRKWENCFHIDVGKMWTKKENSWSKIPWEKMWKFLEGFLWYYTAQGSALLAYWNSFKNGMLANPVRLFQAATGSLIFPYNFFLLDEIFYTRTQTSIDFSLCHTPYNYEDVRKRSQSELLAELLLSPTSSMRWWLALGNIRRLLSRVLASWSKIEPVITYSPQFFLFFIFKYFLGGFFLFCSVQYSALLYLPPLRFHCADGCWDRIQDLCNWCIGSQTL
jgi:hypothetical protein